MPTYQYVCTACGEDLEAVQSFTDAALTECPACAGRLRKKFGSVGVVFKGSGFYRNDSRGGGLNGSAGSEKPAGEKSGSEKSAADGAAEKAPSTAGSGSPAAGSGSNGSSASGAGSSGGSASKSSPVASPAA